MPTPPSLPAAGLRCRLTYYMISLRPPNDPDEVEFREYDSNALLTMGSFAWQKDALIEGTARYRDTNGESATINIAQDGKRWQQLSYDQRWGLGVTDPASKTSQSFKLRPFRSIAVDPKVMAIGKWYYVKELDGLQMVYPLSTLKHDGLVRAVDTGPAIRGAHIDFFVGYEKSWHALERLYGKQLAHVTVYES